MARDETPTDLFEKGLRSQQGVISASSQFGGAIAHSGQPLWQHKTHSAGGGSTLCDIVVASDHRSLVDWLWACPGETSSPIWRF